MSGPLKLFITNSGQRKEFGTYLDQYYKLRKSEYKPGTYTGEADAYDNRQDTLHYLYIENEAVIGGLRILFRGSKSPLKFEATYTKTIADIIGHIEGYENLVCAELSGVVTDSNQRGRGLGKSLQSEAIDFCYLDDVDVIFARLSEANIGLYCSVLSSQCGQYKSAFETSADFFVGKERRLIAYSIHAAIDTQIAPWARIVSGEVAEIHSNTEIGRRRDKKPAGITYKLDGNSSAEELTGVHSTRLLSFDETLGLKQTKPLVSLP